MRAYIQHKYTCEPPFQSFFVSFHIYGIAKGDCIKRYIGQETNKSSLSHHVTNLMFSLE